MYADTTVRGEIEAARLGDDIVAIELSQAQHGGIVARCEFKDCRH